MSDFEDIMHSYGLDPSNPDHLDELLYRINMENDDVHIFDPDYINERLSDYVDIDEYYDEYSDDEDDDLIRPEDC